MQNPTQTQVTNSILNDVKRYLGITEDCTSFDFDIIIHINAAIASLIQMGVGPDYGYSVVDVNNTWDEFISDETLANMAKPIVFLKVKMLFDPVSNTTVKASYDELLKEFQYRAYIQSGGC